MSTSPVTGIRLRKSFFSSFCPWVRKVQRLSFNSWDAFLCDDSGHLQDHFLYQFPVHYNGWFFGCFTFRLCRIALFRCLTFQVLPLFDFRFIYFRVILCFNLRNLVETLCWAATRTSIRGILSGKCLPMLPVACNLKTSLSLEVAYINAAFASLGS